MFQCASLGSGSKGNATLVRTPDTCLLVDCGFGLKETQSRLQAKGLSIDAVDAILVTHEHGDHSSGVARLARRFDIPVWLSRGTALHRSCVDIDSTFPLVAESTVRIGSIEILPFTVPHDAREPLQFRFTHQQRHLGLVTDTGHFTQHMLDVLAPVSTLLLEFNHCPERLAQSRYPPSLRQRIAGMHGHLSNQQALSVVAAGGLDSLKSLVALHLSEENNHPDQVEQMVTEVFSGHFQIANQSDGFDWLTI
ncbi:MAG: MBL fold metallo-hydrolase [Gammaproteobacteria bacterium]|nr:MBL fold metallo-hydrolase [Gammaproteobacteria bacterium]